MDITDSTHDPDPREGRQPLVVLLQQTFQVWCRCDINAQSVSPSLSRLAMRDHTDRVRDE